MSQKSANQHSGFFLVGKIIRTHGYKGGLKAIFDVDQPEEYSQLEMIFVETKGQLIPWMIESLHFENNKVNLKLSDLHNMEGAEKLVGDFLYLPLELLPKLKGNKFYYHEVLGFKVLDKKLGDIGIIDRVIELPNNPLFTVIFQGKEILVPISDNIIKKVDRKKRQIEVETPEGLVGMFNF